MESPIAKLAVAAVVIMACGIGLSLWRTTGSGIALADVLVRMDEIKAYSYQSRSSMTDEDDPGDNGTGHSSVLTSQEYGTKTISEERDPNGRVTSYENYWLPKKRTMITLRPQEKKYMRIEFDDAWARRIEDSYRDPRWKIRELMTCKYKSLGRSQIEGAEVEGFQTTDPNYANDFGAKGVEVKVWVNVKTQLPVRLEEDLVFDKMHIRDTTYDYRWDVRAEAADFEPVIPPDYQPSAGLVTKWPALTEELALQGLRQCLEFLGRYPETTDWDAYGSAVQKSGTPAALRLQEEVKDLPADEKANRLVEATLPMRCLSRFYAGLQFDKKAPAYYGRTVTPKDVDKVLLRWKLSDKEYRVIFGDLHAETVSPEKLAELEKGLPK